MNVNIPLVPSLSTVKAILIGIVVGIIILMCVGMKLLFDRTQTLDANNQALKFKIQTQDALIEQNEQDIKDLRTLQERYNNHRQLLNEQNAETIEQMKKPPVSEMDRVDLQEKITQDFYNAVSGL